MHYHKAKGFRKFGQRLHFALDRRVAVRNIMDMSEPSPVLDEAAIARTERLLRLLVDLAETGMEKIREPKPGEAGGRGRDPVLAFVRLSAPSA